MKPDVWKSQLCVIERHSDESYLEISQRNFRCLSIVYFPVFPNCDVYGIEIRIITVENNGSVTSLIVTNCEIMLPALVYKKIIH